MTHYDDDTLSRYGLDAALVDDPESVAAHLASCDPCRARMEELREIDTAMRHAETWTQVDALTTRSARLNEALALKARIDDEDRAAERLVARHLTSPLWFRQANLSENPKALHAGVVRSLCAAAHRLHEERPEFSLLIARTAYAIAFKLDKDPQTARRLYMGCHHTDETGRRQSRWQHHHADSRVLRHRAPEPHLDRSGVGSRTAVSRNGCAALSVAGRHSCVPPPLLSCTGLIWRSPTLRPAAGVLPTRRRPPPPAPVRGTAGAGHCRGSRGGGV